MENIQITTRIIRCEEAELSPEELLLVQSARRVALKAYSPYSGFKVGAALLLNNGETITGNNQENVAYPSGLCAERVALFYANAKFPFVPVKMLAVAAFNSGDFTETISPCGACRQVMAEVEKRFDTPVKLLLCGKKEILIVERAGTLLPLNFVL